jgi:hypothetical protein
MIILNLTIYQDSLSPIIELCRCIFFPHNVVEYQAYQLYVCLNSLRVSCVFLQLNVRLYF